MPPVSKYPVSNEVYERVFEVFSKSIVKLETKNQVAEFLDEFLTPTERIMLAKRLAIAFLIVKGYEYREISRILRVSTNTVGRVNFAYRNGEIYKVVVDKVLQDEKVDEFLEGVGEKVSALFASGGSKSGTWRYLREEIKKRRRRKSF